MRRIAVTALLATALLAQRPAAPRADPVAAYLPFFVTYAGHAVSIWHPREVDGLPAGYWGDGLSGGNGGVRGTGNLTLACAVLAHAHDRGWLDGGQRAALARLGLDRAGCVARVRESWRYLAAGHASGDGACADGERWGRSWQSSLWIGAAGLAALLVWDDLDDELRSAIGRVVVDEADRKIDQAPRDARPGNTAAEENGWDTHAPAIALALFPRHEHAPQWLRAAQVLAANTLSTPADRASDAPLGADRTGDVVTTSNLFADYTLDNHGFFHPSYLRVSGQELGEALLMLRLGDRRNGTGYRDALRPYAMHHVADAWRTLRRLLLPDGELAFPSGSDWAIHLPSGHSFLAFVATALGDPVAELARRRAFTAAAVQQRASPAGRLLGAADFEWWWEPLLLKRYATALLQLDGAHVPAPADGRVLLGEETWWSPSSRVFVHRTARYFASVSVRGRPTGLVLPLGRDHLAHPYLTTPRVGALMPRGEVVGEELVRHPRGAALVARYRHGATAALVALQDVVLFLADDKLGAFGVQNDDIASPDGRVLDLFHATVPVLPMSGGWELDLPPAFCIDGQLGLLTADGFLYRPAHGYTRRSAAEDLVTVHAVGGATGILLCPRHDAESTHRLSREFVMRRERDRLVVRCRDGVEGPVVEVALAIRRGPRLIAARPSFVQRCRASERHPLAALADDDPATFAVLTGPGGEGPGAAGSVVLAFNAPDAAGPSTALRLRPRPGYGPREVTLYATRAAGRQRVARAELTDETAELPLHQGARCYELEIESGYDRGRATPTPRNTQIAELTFVLPALHPDRPALVVTVE